MCWFRKFRRLFSLFTSNFDILYTGAFLFLTTGLMGDRVYVVCKSGGLGILLGEIFLLFLIDDKVTMLWALGDNFWCLYVGSFLSFWKFFSLRKL